MYYNTTNESVSTLTEYKGKAASQDEKVLSYFLCLYPCEATPFDLQRFEPFRSTPITSIRRSLNTLTNQGKLKKLDRTVPGKYGRPNHLWTLAK